MQIAAEWRTDESAANAVGVLGPLLLIDSKGLATSPAGKRQRRLLAVLTLHRGNVVSVDTLIEIVFEGRPSESADRTLQTYVSRLRGRLNGRAETDSGSVIERMGPGYVLNLPPELTDVGRFEELLDDAHEAAARADRAEAVNRRGDRGPSRESAEPWPARRGHRRPRSLHIERSHPGTATTTVDAGAMPLGTPRGGTACLQRLLQQAGRAGGTRALAGDQGIGTANRRLRPVTTPQPRSG
jgi:DNA-binding winged helix-turn-helix (wHTH) protein